MSMLPGAVCVPYIYTCLSLCPTLALPCIRFSTPFYLSGSQLGLSPPGLSLSLHLPTPPFSLPCLRFSPFLHF